jgi:hypothetical protein
MKLTIRAVLLLCAPFVFALTLGAPPASGQGCSVCTSDGECVPVNTSGNCYCNVRHTDKGYRICRPAGICDLLDPNSCDEGGGPQPTGFKVSVDAAGISRLEDQDSLVGTAIRAAAEQTFAPNGAPTGSHFAVGIYEGTLRKLDEESGYGFRIVISKGEAGSVKMQGKLTAAAGDVIEFEAHLREGGRSGRVQIARDSRGEVPRTLTWKDEEKTLNVK